MRGLRAWVLGTLAMAATLVVPATAPATVTCDVLNGGGLDIRITTPLEIALMERSGGDITVRQSATPVTCLNFASQPVTPTIAGTPFISMASEPGVTGAFALISDAVGFSSIPIFVNLRNDPNSLLSVRVGDFPGPMVFGTAGVDTDPGTNGDLDITTNNVPRVDARGNSTVPVDFNAQGGGATGGPLTVGTEFLGSTAADSIHGGEGDDQISTFDNIDTIDGHSGADRIKPGAGNDTIQGGPGNDVVDYSDLSAGVAVDLRISGAQATGGGGNDTLSSIENLHGTVLVDILRGDGGTNRIDGIGGVDLIDGRAGRDEIFAGVGDDEIEARDGGPDAVDCGAGTDKVTADPAGVDAITGCEEIDFAPPPAGPPAPSPSPQPTSSSSPPGTLPGAPQATPTGPASITSLRLAPVKFTALPRGPSVRKPGGQPLATIVSYRLDQPAVVTFRVARRLRAPKGLVLLRGSFTRTGLAGLNRFRFTGRIAGHALATGSYQLQATPVTGTVSGAIARAGFRIAG